MDYLKIPTTVNYQDLISHKNRSFSPSDYLTIEINCKTKNFEDFIEKTVTGKEVGSDNYTEFSPLKFIRTKSIQNESMLLNLDEAIGVNPHSFRNFNLKKGDILLVKDSNIGEVCYVDKDLPHHTISGGIVKINLKDEVDKFYIFGMIKSSFFKEQIDLLSPKGAIIRHSRDNYKRVQIPISDDKEFVKKISTLTESIILKEMEIKKKFSEIQSLIDKELMENQGENQFSYHGVNYNDLIEKNRFDTGLYTEVFRKNEFIISNYLGGTFYLKSKDLKSGSTPKEDQRIMNFGDINWITPTNITDFGTMDFIPKIAIKNHNFNIKRDSLLFINRTSKGKKGEYVGITFFYDFKEFGKAQHNQGLYRLENRSKTELLFLMGFMNSKIVRKLCSSISKGSKMKEMKSIDFEQIPIPIFPEQKQKEIAKLYSNPNESYLNHISDLNLSTFKQIDDEVTQNSGILDLDKQIKKMKSIVDIEIKRLVNAKENFNY